FNLYAAVTTYIPQHLVRNDFRLIYGAALNGWEHGYSRLYDLAAQKATVEGLQPGTYWSPFLNPPTLAWVATPFLGLPFDLALLLWTALLVGAALFAWRLVAPGAGLTRAAHLALFLGLFPTAFGLMVGQPVALVAAAAAGRQRGLGTSRPIATGIVASLLFTPYVGFQDFAILVVAGWLLVRSGATSVQVALMVIGYALLELALLVLAVPILLAEA